MYIYMYTYSKQINILSYIVNNIQTWRICLQQSMVILDTTNSA